MGIEGIGISPVVYVMAGWSSPDLYKIGCTASVRNRFGSKAMRARIECVIPVPAEMNLYEAERMVHELFSAKRAGRAEVFALTVEDLASLGRVRFFGGVAVIGEPCAD